MCGIKTLVSDSAEGIETATRTELVWPGGVPALSVTRRLIAAERRANKENVSSDEEVVRPGERALPR